MTDQTRDITPFITRWRASAAAERANYQLFLIGLCDLLSVERPGVALAALGRPVTAEEVAAAFEGKVTRARREQVAELLQTLEALGQARSDEDGRWREG